MRKKTIVRKWAREQQFGNGQKNNSSEMDKKKQQFGNG